MTVNALLLSLSSRTYDLCVPEFRELKSTDEPLLSSEIHRYVLTLSVINPQISLIAELVSELSSDEKGRKLRKEIIHCCQAHLQSCSRKFFRCCAANVVFIAELFKRELLSERVALGIAHRLLFGYPASAAYLPTYKDVVLLSALLASVGFALDLPPTEMHMSQLIARVREVKAKVGPCGSLLDLLCWCRSRKWDTKLAQQITQAAHRCVAEFSLLPDCVVDQQLNISPPAATAEAAATTVVLHSEAAEGPCEVVSVGLDLFSPGNSSWACAAAAECTKTNNCRTAAIILQGELSEGSDEASNVDSNSSDDDSTRNY